MLAFELARLRRAMLPSRLLTDRPDFAVLRRLPATAAERLELSALELLHHPQMSPAEARGLLPEAADLLERAQSLAAPIAEAAAWRALLRLQLDLKLLAAALHSNTKAVSAYERAQASELAFALRAQRCLLLFTAEMFSELRTSATELLRERERLDPHQRHQILNGAASAAYYLAMELEDESLGTASATLEAEQLWQECVGWHHQALALAEQIESSVPRTVTRLNLAIVNATRGDLEACEPLLATLEPDATEVLPGCQAWISHCRLLLRLHREPPDIVWPELQAMLGKIDPDSLDVPGIREAGLRAIERFAVRCGLIDGALQAVQARMQLRRRQTHELGLALGQTVQDVMEHPRLLHENESLARHGHDLQDSLLERNADLQRALQRLSAEIETRHTAERALQQTHDELERQVAQRSSDLEHALHQLISQERQLALSRMMAGMAHEMNTPLDTARMAASAIHESARDLRARLDNATLRRHQLSQLSEALDQASAMMQRGLGRVALLRQRFSSVTRDPNQDRLEPLDLAALIQTVVDGWQGLLHQRSVRLQLDLPPKAELIGNQEALQQVLQQLLENSLQHGLSGRSDGQLSLSLEADGEYWLMDWADNGCGIDADNLTRVFEPFFTTQLGRTGTGLGLSCVHSLIVELMGGSVQLESQLGLGTRVLIRLRQIAAPSSRLDSAAEAGAAR